MRRHIHFAEEPRRNYLPLALTALALLTMFACDRREPEQTATAPTDQPVVIDDSVVETPVESRTPTYENTTYEDAESTFTSRRYSEATEMFAAYVTRRPQNPWGHYMLGLSAWKSGQLPRARESFERAIELDPSHVKSLLNLSRVLLELKEPREASERVLSALKLDSTSAETHRLMGRVQTALGESEDALESYRTALTLDAHDVWAMNNMGLLLIQLGRFEEALGPLARAVQLDSGVAVFRNNFGMALERTGHFVAAAESYRAAVSIDPDYAKASASLTRIGDRGDDPGAEPIDVALLTDDFVRDLETWKAERVAVSEQPVIVVPVEAAPPERGHCALRRIQPGFARCALTIAARVSLWAIAEYFRGMQDAHDFLRTLAVVLCAAGLTTVIFQRLRQPVVFGYLLAGMIVGPHVPIPIVADEATVQALAETGVILLLFSLGLEFSLRKLIRVGPRAGIVAVVQGAMMIWLGYSLGRAFGWTGIESFYAGAIIAISSTTIIAKAFQEQRVTGKFTELVLGILIIEDLIAIFLLTVLTTLSTGASVSAGSLAVTGMRLGMFLTGLIVVGLLLIPRTVRTVVRMNRPETTLIASMGICFAAALLAYSFGYSVALGAFIAGSLVAESGEEKTVAHLIEPVRDVFAAIFFVAVGMLIDPELVAQYWLPVVVFTIAVIAGQVVIVTISAFLTGFSPRTSLQAGMSLAQIGEFSFIIAGIGISTGATRDFLYPIAVAVSALTTLTTPWLIRGAGPAAAFVDSKLPRPIQTFVTLYGSWMERMRESRASRTQRPRVRRVLGLLLLDVVAIALVLIGAALETRRFSVLLSGWSGLTTNAARMVVIAGMAAITLPLVVGFFRSARQLGNLLAHEALPAVEKGVDFAAAPRRALVVTLQLAVVIVAVVFLVAVSKPFYPRMGSTLVVGVGVGVLLLVLGVTFWRTAADLYGHARAGAEVIVAVLAQQMATEQSGGTSARKAPSLDTVGKILPGLGDPVSLRIEPGSALEGQTLAGVNLRGLTGATVLAIVRGDQQVLMPSGQETLHEGDVLAVVGSHEAVESARMLIAGGATPVGQGTRTE